MQQSIRFYVRHGQSRKSTLFSFFLFPCSLKAIDHLKITETCTGLKEREVDPNRLEPPPPWICHMYTPLVDLGGGVRAPGPGPPLMVPIFYFILCLLKHRE